MLANWQSFIKSEVSQYFIIVIMLILTFLFSSLYIFGKRGRKQQISNMAILISASLILPLLFYYLIPCFLVLCSCCKSCTCPILSFEWKTIVLINVFHIMWVWILCTDPTNKQVGHQERRTSTVLM